MQKEVSENRKRKLKTNFEVETWEHISEYARANVFTDNPRSWSVRTSLELGYGEGWLSSLRSRPTSVPVNAIVEVCEILDSLRPRSAPPIRAALAFAAADRRTKGTESGILCFDLPLIDQLQLSREARDLGKSFNEHIRDILLARTRGELLR